MTYYIIVNAVTRRPVIAMGFQSSYAEKSEADAAAARWNTNRLPSTCRVKVVRVTI